MTTTPTTTPANARLVGDGPSFTLGVEDRPWGDSPSAPTTVCTEWSFSTCSPIYDPETNEILPGVQCTSFRTNGLPHPADWDRHPELDKRVFPTAADARRMAYNLGVLRYFYYRSGR